MRANLLLKGVAMSKRDYYEVLGAAKGASADELKKRIARRRKSCTRTEIPTTQTPKASSKK